MVRRLEPSGRGRSGFALGYAKFRPLLADHDFRGPAVLTMKMVKSWYVRGAYLSWFVWQYSTLRWKLVPEEMGWGTWLQEDQNGPKVPKSCRCKKTTPFTKRPTSAKSMGPVQHGQLLPPWAKIGEVQFRQRWVMNMKKVKVAGQRVDCFFDQHPCHNNCLIVGCHQVGAERLGGRVCNPDPCRWIAVCTAVLCSKH